MQVETLKNNKFFWYLNNLDSSSIGFYFSFILHLIILLLAMGLPNFFKPDPISLPNIIPVEIINVTEETFISEKVQEKNVEVKKKTIDKTYVKQKKFNNSEIQEIQKIEKTAKPKPEIDKSKNLKTPKEDIIIKEKAKSPIKLEKEKKILTKETIESIPTKKIKPKIKPEPLVEQVEEEKKSDVIVKVQPKPKPEKEFSIASMLKDLRNEKSMRNTEKKEKKEKEEKEEEVVSQEKKITEENIALSISEIDLLRQQLSSCWIAPAGAVIKKGMFVKISAKLQQNRRIHDNSVRIVDTNISKNNPFYGPITESAMRTLLNPDCIPLKLPENKYDLWKKLTITFDYSIMKGYE